MTVSFIGEKWYGSSPLARGLLVLVLLGGGLGGIIPARAGFTSADTLRYVSEADHPRSRGVYATSVAAVA